MDTFKLKSELQRVAKSWNLMQGVARITKEMIQKRILDDQNGMIVEEMEEEGTILRRMYKAINNEEVI